MNPFFTFTTLTTDIVDLEVSRVVSEVLLDDTCQGEKKEERRKRKEKEREKKGVTLMRGEKCKEKRKGGEQRTKKYKRRERGRERGENEPVVRARTRRMSSKVGT
jgi:hypothetical protein